MGLNLYIFNLAMPLGVTVSSYAQQTSKDRGTNVTSQAWEERHLKVTAWAPGTFKMGLCDADQLANSLRFYSEFTNPTETKA